MESRQKKMLIGGLLAVILLMAVGYAAFATQLSIDGAANVSSTWNVHFDPTKTSGAGVIDITNGTLNNGSVSTLTPTASISYSNNNLTAALTANLKQPGDIITYTLTVINEGSLSAIPGNPNFNLAGSTVVDNNDGTWTITKDHVQYTVTKPTRTLAQNQTDVMIVEAEFIDTTAAVAAHCSDPTYQTQQACETAGQSDDTIRWIPATSGKTDSLTVSESPTLNITVTYTQAS